MPNQRPYTPAYCFHKASGKAFVRLNGEMIYLGEYGSPESRAEYDRLIAEWLARGRTLPPEEPAALSVNEMLLAYLTYAEKRYCRNGKLTPAYDHIKYVIGHVRLLFGMTPARDFGPLRLEAVRQRFIENEQCRSYVNANVGRVRRAFKWGVSRQMIPPETLVGLQALEDLRHGESEVRESKPVKPVPDSFVDTVLPYLSPEVGCMVELQRLTGMRSGEVASMRTSEIDTTGEVWCYRPAHHKTEHHGHEREVWFCPKAQKILKPWLRPNLSEFLFSPRRAEQTRYAACEVHRHQPVKKSKTGRRLGDRYTSASYRRAITYGIAKANEEIRKWNVENGTKLEEIPAWHPHQLRHNFAKMVRKEHGIEAARILLGHRDAGITLIYAEADREKARSIAAKIG